MSFYITTDAVCDLPQSYLQEHEVEMVSLAYTMDGELYNNENTLTYPEFYAKMRGGSMPTTSQTNIIETKELFERVMKEKDCDILHISFSSALSGTYGVARMVAEELNESDNGHRIIVVDSLCASLGQGLLIHKAVELRENGESLDDVATWVEEHKLNVVHNVMVDDLNHLYRGGRVSRTVAFVGSLINIKPILHIDDEGRLVPISKVRGRKKAILTLVDSMEKQMGSWKGKNDIVFISHGDALIDAQYLAETIKERLGIESFLIDYIDPVIGAHAGPGTVALFYMGDVR